MKPQEAWFITERWQEYEGELRVALVRLFGILVFYVIELVNFYGIKLGSLEIPSVVDDKFHFAATALALGWALVSFAVIFSLKQKFFPRALMYFTTALDFVFLCQFLMLADGPRSPLTPLFFLLLALAGLRFHLPLVWFSVAASISSYVFLVGYAHYMAHEKSVPFYHELIFVASLALMGVLVGQVTRRVRSIAVEYQERLTQLDSEGGNP